jgi:hypothetical protein
MLIRLRVATYAPPVVCESKCRYVRTVLKWHFSVVRMAAVYVLFRRTHGRCDHNLYTSSYDCNHRVMIAFPLYLGRRLCATDRTPLCLRTVFACAPTLPSWMSFACATSLFPWTSRYAHNRIWLRLFRRTYGRRAYYYLFVAFRWTHVRCDYVCF